MSRYNKTAQRYAKQMAHYLLELWGANVSKYKPPTVECVRPARRYNKIKKKWEYRIPNIDALALFWYEENKIILIQPSKHLNYTSTEYKRFNDNPVIGMIKCDPKTRLLGDLAHEMAHWFQMRVTKEKDIFSRDHGRGFQLIYALLREKFVNNRPGVTKLGKKVIRYYPKRIRRKKKNIDGKAQTTIQS